MFKYMVTPMLNDDESGRKAGRQQANGILMQALGGMTSVPSHPEGDAEVGQCFEGTQEELGSERRVVDVASHVDRNEGHVVYRPPIQN
jgi:hypothetical protein